MPRPRFRGSSRTGPVPATVSVTLQAGRPHFARSRYHAPAGQAFTLKITHSLFSTTGKPLWVTLLISPSDNPAIAPVPGRPGFGIIDPGHASFVAPRVTAPGTGVFTVSALAAGTYFMQIMEAWGRESSAALIVR